MRIKQIFLIGLLYVSTAHAVFLKRLDRTANTANTSSWATFVPPNEPHPHLLLDILRDAPRGVYVSVGTERGFVGASLARGVTHLLLVDYNDTVVFFNRMNIALLAAAEDLADYRRLRLDAPFSEWLKAAQSGVDLSPATRNSLSDASNFKLWRKLVKRTTFNKFHFPPKLSESFRPAFNYQINVRLFYKLQLMARAGHIVSTKMNLKTEQKDYAELLGWIAAEGLKVAVLDISNSWYKNFIGIDQSLRLISLTGQFTRPSARFVLTGENGWAYWSYLGFTFQNLARPGRLETLEGFWRKLAETRFFMQDIPGQFANALDPDLDTFVHSQPEASVPGVRGKMRAAWSFLKKTDCARTLEE